MSWQHWGDEDCKSYSGNYSGPMFVNGELNDLNDEVLHMAYDQNFDEQSEHKKGIVMEAILVSCF